MKMLSRNFTEKSRTSSFNIWMQVLFTFAIFLLFTSLMLYKKGLLTSDRIIYLATNIFPVLKKQEEEKNLQEYLPYKKEREIIAAVENIEKEKKALEEEKKRLKELEEKIRIQKKELEEKAEELFALKSQIEDYLKKGNSLREEKVKWIAQVYEKMRAEEVAPVLQQLDNELVIEILSRMDQRQAGKILAAMDVKEVSDLTKKIGERISFQK